VKKLLFCEPYLGGPIETSLRSIIGTRRSKKNFMTFWPGEFPNPGSEGAKVFWFFFSKKNVFLSNFLES
jgi:hypothetical protein